MLTLDDLIIIIPNLCQNKWESYKLKGLNFEKSILEEIVLTNYEQAMMGFLQLYQKIKTMIQEDSTVGNQHYDILAKV